MIAGDSGDVGGVLISVVVDHEHGVSLPCLLYQMLSGLCVIPVVLPPPPFVAWKFSLTRSVEESLPTCWCQSGCWCSALVPCLAAGSRAE